MKKITYINLICCTCGQYTKGRQWWNRDKGYGICGKCIEWLKEKGYTKEQLEFDYGVENINYIKLIK